MQKRKLLVSIVDGSVSWDSSRLLAEWAQLAQLAAWMADDAGQHGLAQRYFTSGLHAAHTAGDRSVGVSLLACMNSTAVYRGPPTSRWRYTR
ncbi:MAG: hypothetical protein ACRDRW_03015 [Pseudonocardiaceae bacterium]